MNHFIARMISLVLSLILSALILLYPQIVIDDNNQANHKLLMLFLSGTMLGFIHGVGFHIKSSLGRYLLSPLISWPIMLGGIWLSLSKASIL